MIELLAKLALYVAPMYFANSSAMIFGGRTPVDFGAKFLDNRPLLGRGKTIKGSLAGIACGTIAGLVISFAYPFETGSMFTNYLLLSFLGSLGAIIGDMAGSFFKRRLGIDSGKEAFLLDQLDFVAGGVVLGLAVYVPSLVEIIIICVATLIIHKLSNWVAYKANLKRVPW